MSKNNERQSQFGIFGSALEHGLRGLNPMGMVIVGKEDREKIRAWVNPSTPAPQDKPPTPKL